VDAPAPPSSSVPPEAPPPDERLAATPWVISTYFAEGLPFSIVRQLSAEFFTSMGAKLEDIGFTSLYGLAWNAKLLWSPLVDRYGTLRRWLVGVQALLGLVVMAVAWRAGEGDLGGVARILVVAAFLAATHDIAIDGFYLEALGRRTQTALAGLRSSAYRVAMLAGKGLLVLAGALQVRGVGRTAAWRITFIGAGAALILLAGVHALALPRPPPRHRGGAVAGPAPRYRDAFVSFLAQPRVGVSIAFIVLYKAGDSLMWNMNAPFLRSLGLGDLIRGYVGSGSLVVSISGAIASGAVIARYGLARTLRPIVAVQSFAILLYVALAAVRPGVAAVSAVALLEQLAGGVGDGALAVFLMRRCSAEHKAAHYAIASALMSVMATAAGVSSGYLVNHVGFPVFFTLAFVASLPGLALAWLVPQE
jgi:MFS transporter, PAT family, beta-lactamase induction signal transducer AmpG